MSIINFNTAQRFNKSLIDFDKMSKKRESNLYSALVKHCLRSIKFGSATTGAPGQPVDTEALRKSWTKKGTLASRDVEISTHKKYAPKFEAGGGSNFVLRSKVGGFHSVRLTRLNWRWVVKEELAIVKDSVK